jgi:hypothetical protein
MLLAAVAASTGALALAACSSVDPAAVHFGAHDSRDAGTSLAIDSGAPPIDNTPDAGSGTPIPDANAVVDTGVDAGDASDAPSGPAVLSFTLLDTSVTTAVQGTPVLGQDPMKTGSSISLGTVGATLSVRANLNVTTIGSVGFAYDATNHTENATPYTLCGDNGAGTITDCNLAAGQHTLTATPYSAADLGGIAGTPLTITFTLTP